MKRHRHTAANGRLLVLSVVHQADDPRVRLRTVGVLARAFDVRYATRGPGPVERGDHQWVELPGTRLQRHVNALREAFRSDVDVLSLHDPELLPLGLAVRALRRIPVVFDLHEDLPAQIRTKRWLPRMLREPVAAVSALALRIAEHTMTITLAEPGYARLFRRDHPALPNYPLVDQLPALDRQSVRVLDRQHEPAIATVRPAGSAAPTSDVARSGPSRAPTSETAVGDIVYVGDVTEARGAMFMLDVVARMAGRHRLRLIGRCAPSLRRRLIALATERGVDLDLPGFISHAEAMRAVAVAGVGVCPLEDQPNYRHSLPTKIVEYLALGLPVVASDLPGTAELAGDRPGVQLVGARDGSAWAVALERALREPRWHVDAIAGAPEIRERFTWPADRLLDTYLAAVQPTGSSTGTPAGGIL